MQRFLLYSKNKIFMSLTIILLIAILVTIRECEYPLLLHSEFAKLCFVPKYSEKLFYNLSLSYIAAYIFYIIQIYIPQTLMNKRACHILEEKFQKEFRLTTEFFFLINHIVHMTEASTIRYNIKLCTFYFKEYNGSDYILKRFSEINTLKQLANDIQKEFTAIENNKYYNELDSYIIEFHSLFPLASIQKSLECIIYSFETTNNLQVVSNDLISPINHFLHKMRNIIPGCTEVILSSCTDCSLIEKYENACTNSGLNEYKFALQLNKHLNEMKKDYENPSPVNTIINEL